MDSLVERLGRWSRFGYGVEASVAMIEAAARITELERQVKVAREGLMKVTDYGDLQAVRTARQALASMGQADD